jgi:hypothetical protein
MERIQINNRKIVYRGFEYDIASHERIGNECVHVTTTTGMTIALVPSDTEINGVIAKKIEDIENALK